MKIIPILLSFLYLLTLCPEVVAKRKHVECTIFRVEPLMIDPEQGEGAASFFCEDDSGHSYTLEGVESDLMSGQRFLGYADVSEESLTMVVDPEANDHVITAGISAEMIAAAPQGDQSLLIVYVVAPDVNNFQSKENFVSDVFGICDSGCTHESPDSVNLKTQMLACSAGKLNFVPAACPSEATKCNNANLIVNGAITVKVDGDIKGVASGTVKNTAEVELNKLLLNNGIGSDIHSDWYKMYIFSKEAAWGGAAAWAFMPGTVSAFRDDYANRMGVQLHELGHNFNFHHSGYRGSSYADHSCMMGNPSYGDDGPKICFNGAKNWESSWFEDDIVEVNVVSGQNLESKLVGIDDYSSNNFSPGEHKLVIKISDLYVMYNKKKGINGGVTFFQDKVTVVRGASREVSSLVAYLGESSKTYSVPDFSGSGKTLVVELCEFGTTDNDANTARVLVSTEDNQLRCEPAPPTVSPVPSNSPAPSFTPTVKPLCVKTGLISDTNSGTPFDDECHPGIKSILVNSGWWFDGIQITYLDGLGKYYGGDGGDNHVAELEDGEGIIEVSAMEHAYSYYGLEYLRFKTDTGREINFDTDGDTMNGDTKTWKASEGYVLGGIHGKSGQYLNTIGLYWVSKLSSTTTPSATPSENSTGSSSPSIGSNDAQPLSWDIKMISHEVEASNENGRAVISVLYESSKRDYDVVVYKRDCETLLNILPVSTKHSNSETKKGFIDVKADVSVNQVDIENSDIWEGNGGTGGSFSFCLSKSLYWDDRLKDESRVTKKNVIFDVSIDNLADFAVGGIVIEVENPETEDVAIQYQGTVTAYLCNEETYERLSDVEPLGPFDVMNICVEEEDDNAVVVTGFVDLTITQTDSFATFLAFEDGNTPASYQDLVNDKTNGMIYMAQVHLIDAFFVDVQPLIVKGKVTLGGSARKLGEESHEFELKVDLAEPCEEVNGDVQFLGKLLRGLS